MARHQKITLGFSSFALDAIIGVRPQERLQKQPLDVSLSVSFALEKECVTLDDTVDYSVFADFVRKAAAQEPGLLEQMAQSVLRDVLASDARIESAEIEIKKLNAVPGADYAFVRMSEERDQRIA